MKIFLAALFLLFALVGQTAGAQDFPALTGRVVDNANLLNEAQEAELTAKLATLETNTQRQLVIATITDLQGYDIADYGYQLGRKWGLGDEDRNDGALLIIAVNDRKIRVEVGYGLEATLTDAVSSQIIRNDITPAFKARNFAGGINAGADKMISYLALPPEEAAKVAASAAAAHNTRKSNGGDFGAILFWLFIFFFFILPILSSMRKGGRKHRGSGYGGPVIIWGGGDWGGGGGGFGGGGGGFGGGGFGGGGGSFGGGGASGGW